MPVVNVGLISGTTKGILESILKADELSITTAPASTAIGAYFLLTEPQAEKSAISIPLKLFSFTA